MTTTVKMPEPHGWKWRRKNTDSCGVYLEDPRKFGIAMDHPEYEWSEVFTAAQLQAYGDARMLEERERCAVIVENSDTPDGWSNSHIAEQLRKGTP